MGVATQADPQDCPIKPATRELEAIVRRWRVDNNVDNEMRFFTENAST